MRVNALWATSSNQLISGGQDGLVKVWQVNGTNLTCIRTIDVKSANSVMPAVVSVCEQDGKILVGTRGAEIIEYDANNSPSVLMRGHFDSELWGLALHPTDQKVATMGRDCYLCVWDLKTHKQVTRQKQPLGGDAIAYSHSGKLVAIGFLNGLLRIVNADDLSVVCEVNDRKGKSIQVVKFSPDDKVVVVGGHDSQIFSYSLDTSLKPMHKMKGHSSTVKFIDFSLDGSAI